MAWKKGERITRKHRKKISSSMKKYFSNPSSRKKHSAAMKKRYIKNPHLVKQIDRAITKWWKEHPNIKKEMSIRAKKLFISNPDKFKKFLRYGNNPASTRFKTKQGFKVRSKGEKTIANFLHDNSISSQYESKTLIFKEEGQICVPDFYLPSFKIYVEFYGGHPKAYKKKLLKNKLYAKHKIPVISITPAELRNLRKYLLGEIRGKT